MMLAVLHRMRQWLHWRRLVRRMPELRRCWRIVRSSGEFRPGPFTIDAEICQPPAHGANPVAVITLSYLVKGHPQQSWQETHGVALLTGEYLGKKQGLLSGF